MGVTPTLKPDLLKRLKAAGFPEYPTTDITTDLLIAELGDSFHYLRQYPNNPPISRYQAYYRKGMHMVGDGAASPLEALCEVYIAVFGK